MDRKKNYMQGELLILAMSIQLEFFQIYMIC